MLEHHDVDKIVCPWCAAVHDCAMSATADPEPPEDGNINICINCSRISVYQRQAPGGLRIPTDEETAEAMADTDVCRALWAVRRSHYHIKRKAN